MLENILNFEKIIVIGGDGTINEVVNGFLNLHLNILPILRKVMIYSQFPPRAVFYIVPGGTRNILAKSLNIPIDPMLVCHNLKGLNQKRWI
ncbi:MAG: acylglycerol kinase family protein [Nitrososphaeraceae archaeon]